MKNSIDRDKLITPQDYADHFDRVWGISQEEKDYLILLFKDSSLPTNTESREVEGLKNELEAHKKSTVMLSEATELLYGKDKEIEDLMDVLSECKLQLEYLSGKFKETGTTNSLLSRIKSKI